MARFLLPLLAVLALPASAAAKEITAVRVCGVHSCTRLTDHAAMQAFMNAGGFAEAAPRTPQRSYLLRVEISEPHAQVVDQWTSYWLPDAGLIASRDDAGELLFTRVEPALERVLRDAAAGRPARPARRFVRRVAKARVDEVVEPPAAAAPTSRAAAGAGSPATLAWAGGAALLLLACACAVLLRLRRPV